MRRRELLLLLSGGAVAASPGALAQRSARPRRVGAMSWFAGSEIPLQPHFEARLGELGVIVGRDIIAEYHYAAGDGARAAGIAADLVARGFDIILAFATPAALAAKKATRTIPIVFVSANAVLSGLVESLSHPGGNLTGVSTASTYLSGKRVELLREMVPGLASLAFLGSTGDPNTAVFAAETEAAGARLGIEVHRFMVAGPEEFAGAFARMAAGRIGAVVIQPLFVDHRAALAALALRHRLPTAADQRLNADAGMTMAYGSPSRANIRKMADFVVKILQGRKPADIPIEQPTEFELVINLKSAKALGLTVPREILVFASEVIE